MISTPVIQGIYVVQPISDDNSGVSGKKSKVPSSKTLWYNPIMYLCDVLRRTCYILGLQNFTSWDWHSVPKDKDECKAHIGQ
jgi:hypothetical protein